MEREEEAANRSSAAADDELIKNADKFISEIREKKKSLLLENAAESNYSEIAGEETTIKGAKKTKPSESLLALQDRFRRERTNTNEQMRQMAESVNRIEQIPAGTTTEASKVQYRPSSLELDNLSTYDKISVMLANNKQNNNQQQQQQQQLNYEEKYRHNQDKSKSKLINNSYNELLTTAANNNEDDYDVADTMMSEKSRAKEKSRARFIKLLKNKLKF